ncbi:hypothetical protein FRB90_000775, partial [Tulasnella sp. 427]
MAIGLLGYLFTDFMFVVVAKNARWLVPFGGHHILILGPIMEGLAGGFSTVAAAVNSYVSDVTAHGSRSDAFSRMQGILFIGVAAGPAFSSILLKWTTPDILVIFSVSVFISLLNAIYALFFMPESLTDDIRQEREGKRKAEREEHLATHPLHADSHRSWWARMKAWFSDLFEPAALFLPQGNDWRLTLIGVSFFVCFLTVGLYPLKLLYAEHRFGWTSVEMGSYLTIVGGLRAAHLLVIIPAAIKLFKPVHAPTEPTASNDISTSAPSVPPEFVVAAAKSPAIGTPMSSRQSTPQPGVSFKVTEAATPHMSKQVLADVRFDLNLARISLAVDSLGYLLVVFMTNGTSQSFVLATLLSAFGSGTAPAIQSASLCMLKNPAEDSGKLFGAFSMIQSTAAFVISPLIFGLMYSETVKTFPEAIFLCGGILLAFSCAALILVRPTLPVKKKKRPIRRGRSIRTKVLGGSVDRSGVCWYSDLIAYALPRFDLAEIDLVVGSPLEAPLNTGVYVRLQILIIAHPSQESIIEPFGIVNAQYRTMSKPSVEQASLPQDVVSLDKDVITISHPLDALTPDEISLVSLAVRQYIASERKDIKAVKFINSNIIAPPKRNVLAFLGIPVEPGQQPEQVNGPLARRAETDFLDP